MSDIKKVNWLHKEISFKMSDICFTRIFFYVFIAIPIALLCYVLLIRFGTIKAFGGNQPFEAIADMDHQKKVFPQKLSSFFGDSSSIRQPVKNTVPRNVIKYPFDQTEFADAEAKYVNPLKSDDFVLSRGKNRFEIFCTPCHGYDGRGKGLVITKPKLKEGEEGFPPPANLTRPETIALSDARIFHILSAGQNLMFPVKDKMSETDRWSVVKYLRKLQKDTK